MPRGAQPGERRGGRAKGTPNKRTLRTREELQAVIDAKGTPLAHPARYLLAVMWGEEPSTPERLTAASKVLDRLLPALKAVELSGDAERPITITDTTARQARIAALLAQRNGDHEPDGG